MTYQEEEQSRLRRQASKEAITLALQGQWKEAIAINKSLIEKFPSDVEALNRLGRAHMELGEYRDAEAAYRKTLAIDQYNAIAQKNLQRLSYLKKSKTAADTNTHKLEPQQFIEEIGKAGVVQLNNLAKPAVLARMVAGDVVNLKVNENNLGCSEHPRRIPGTGRTAPRSAARPFNARRQSLFGGNCQLD